MHDTSLLACGVAVGVAGGRALRHGPDDWLGGRLPAAPHRLLVLVGTDLVHVCVAAHEIPARQRVVVHLHVAYSSVAITAALLHAAGARPRPKPCPVAASRSAKAGWHSHHVIR